MQFFIPEFQKEIKEKRSWFFKGRFRSSLSYKEIFETKVEDYKSTVFEIKILSEDGATVVGSINFYLNEVLDESLGFPRPNDSGLIFAFPFNKNIAIYLTFDVVEKMEGRIVMVGD